MLKRSIALLLIGLLVFVHMEKVIHHHESTIVTNQHTGFTTVSSGFFCTVCDYVFAKDADQDPAPPLSISVGVEQEMNSPCLSFFYEEIVFLTNDRGPPAS